MEYIRNFAAGWGEGQGPDEGDDDSVACGEIIVRGEELVSVRMSTEASARGFALGA